MARGRKRSNRSNVPKSPGPSPLSTRSNTPTREEIVGATHSTSSCPACAENPTESPNAYDKENWIRCDICKTWYHWRCAGNGGDVETIDKWYCKSCLEADSTRSITFKAPARKSYRKRTLRDYANLNSGLESDPNRWVRILEGKQISGDPFKRPEGSDVGLEWLEGDENAMTEPIIIERPEGLGMKMPSDDITVDDIAELLGDEMLVEVIDVGSQSTSPGWTLGKWNEYFNLEPAAREKIYNVISLEISGTKLSNMILPPRLVRELDWVENYWPNTRKGKGHIYPKVQLYCLMGVAGAWTDWHVDFAGSSVYYHILHGSKIFYFIRPSLENLAAYEKWSGTELQNHSWLGDMVDQVFKVELTQGNTMIIPTGWIHAVYTPVDTLVFGGNFLHSYNVETQFRVRSIEIATQVPKKFRFPMFSKLCWYVGDKLLRDLKAPVPTKLPSRVLSSMLSLADFLVSEVRILEGGSEQAKKEVKDQVPADRIKDASAMARELRWRLRHLSGYSSDDDTTQGFRKEGSINGQKRKRNASSSPELYDNRVSFKNFKPKHWDGSVITVIQDGRSTLQGRPPGNRDNWTEDWLGKTEEVEGGSEAQVDRRSETMVKVRRTANGLERQRIERVIEEWVWNEN
ncbi:jumonji superfamily protein [Collybia nuda]|uniref:JmjC domain-containing histone demethylation protein 1 n=1 Tax=Collybia nuda TaxID=64659 RepID=A0A9P5XTD3_9AGAR|nr:jumonji superfamily protein [Collybia nuda]